MSKYGFQRKLRLLASAEFSFVFQLPHRASAPQLTLLARENGREHPRLGMIIAKKQLKRAHQRNRCRRLLRESFRHHQHLLPAMDFLALVKKGAEQLDNRDFTVLLERLWRRYHCQNLKAK